MPHYAYLRVSTDEQDANNQKHGVLEYANRNHMTGVIFIEDVITSQKNWKERKIGELVGQLEKGDILLASETTRLGRSGLENAEIIRDCLKAGAIVHIIKEAMIYGTAGQTEIERIMLETQIMMMGQFGKMERAFISKRTKEALARRKDEGLLLGRPKGAKSKKVKLDEHKDQILDYLKKGVSKASVAKIVDCSPPTLYEWLRRNKLDKYIRAEKNAG